MNQSDSCERLTRAGCRPQNVTILPAKPSSRATLVALFDRYTLEGRRCRWFRGVAWTPSSVRFALLDGVQAVCIENCNPLDLISLHKLFERFPRVEFHISLEC